MRLARNIDDPPRGSETLLVVDDYAPIRALLGYVLRGLGYEVLMAASGVEALALLARNRERVKLLLTDIDMPGMDGRQLARRASATRPQLRVIFMSGYEASPAIPSHQFLAKPIPLGALACRLREVLDGAGTAGEMGGDSGSLPRDGRDGAGYEPVTGGREARPETQRRGCSRATEVAGTSLAKSRDSTGVSTIPISRSTSPGAVGSRRTARSAARRNQGESGHARHDRDRAGDRHGRAALQERDREGSAADRRGALRGDPSREGAREIRRGASGSADGAA